jgi:hypothetical protein
VEIAGVEPDHLVERHVVRIRLVLEVVVADEDQPRLDPDRLDRDHAVRPGAGASDRAPELLGVVGRAEDLVAELARVAGPRDPAGDAPDRDLLGPEAEVAEGVHVRVADPREELAGARPLHLEVREPFGQRLDLDVEVACDLAEVIEVGVERGDHPGAIAGELEDGPVTDHLSVLVAEGRVADLADVEPEHVVREDPVGGRERVGPAEVPLAER